MDVADLRVQYPELAERYLVPVDIIDDGETLSTVESTTQDFVIASHFLEHTQDPIGTIEQLLRVLRPGGHLYLAVPLKDYTFDAPRPVTSIEHLVQDHVAGPRASRVEHYREWAEFVDRAPQDGITAKADELMERDYSIHFHVWDEDAFRALIGELSTRLPMRAVHLRRNRHEFIVVAQKLTV